MWRDRTNLYISYRQSYAHHPTKRSKYASNPIGRLGSPIPDTFPGTSSAVSDDRRGLLSAGAFEDDGDAVIEMDLLPPRWADVSDEITEIIGDIARKGQTLERLHQKHVLPGFNDEEAKREQEIEIEKLTQSITRRFHECHRCIQRIGHMVTESQDAGTLTRAEETMAKNIQISLASRVQEASASFRKKQSLYLKKLRGMSGMGDRSASPNPNSQAYNADPSLFESDADRSFSQSTLRGISEQKQLQKSRGANDAIISQREREIEDIAQSIIELSDLFRDLQTMVIDQGTMLDRIDYNVERMAVDIKAAEKELVVASGYQKQHIKRKIILLLLLLIVAAIILLVIKPKKNS
ncbi:T-SNARE affecting a late Golgi compartment protein 2 [Ceratocystis fimbriata CBS 114723]|uniref:t-SNARE affecting a late Golgi compartment protein 2 n=1 Tax=Ceratocystis fimbriata CBS 114723 TaxID=1035309 RepID=A0A2C5WLT7_9PEZI|nr:T-SNARE affecting a late Golgi compartment protein 2 [Ceratocystis fimbriata CBS 114723]